MSILQISLIGEAIGVCFAVIALFRVSAGVHWLRATLSWAACYLVVGWAYGLGILYYLSEGDLADPWVVLMLGVILGMPIYFGVVAIGLLVRWLRRRGKETPV